jgi:hypothetical protein
MPQAVVRAAGRPRPLSVRRGPERNLTNLRETFIKGAVEPIGDSAPEVATLAQANSRKYARLVRELGIGTNWPFGREGLTLPRSLRGG